MKRLINIIPFALAALMQLTACQPVEPIEEPSFSVKDAADNLVLSYVQANEYALDLAYYQYSNTANATNEILKADIFEVNSNCSWRLEASDPDNSTWVRPFPDKGEKEGIFFFVIERNNDQTASRTALFHVIINDGVADHAVPGNIVITQSAAVDFLKTNQATIDVVKEGGNANVTVTSNLPWSYELTPVADYASPAIAEWITDNSKEESTGVSRKLSFKLSDNSNGSIRGALLTITPEGHPELIKTVAITQYGVDVEVSGFPVKWQGNAGNANYPSWPSASNAVPTINAVSGTGTITFIRADVPGINRAASTTDCSGGNPRINGVWPGDYLQFTVPVPVSAGSLIKLQFEGRISGSGVQHWRLEYKDGSEWKVAGTPLTANLPADAKWPAETITYTHDMAPGGSADEYNKIISQVVRYENLTDEVAFRFVAASNVIASSGERMADPTTASARLDCSAGTAGCEPEISCVASGGEVKLADIEVKGLDKDYILFDGTPKAPVSFSVIASEDFTVTPSVDWLTIEGETSGIADEEKTFTVVCEQSTLSDPREGRIVVQAGVTKKNISVIQSAAGQQLDAFISISSGNAITVKADEGTTKVKVQSNVEFDYESTVDWLTIESAGTKALVEWKDFVLTRKANDSPGPRVGTVRFFNTEKNVETVLTVSQEWEEPVVDNNLIQWGFSAKLMPAYKDAFEKDNAFEANVAGKGTISWVDLPENIALDVNSKKSHLIGGTGQPYVSGVWPGDYWQFSIPAVDLPAGTVVNFKALHRISGTGQKYWRMDWSEDGTTWTPVKELQTETETGTSAQYTHIAPTKDVLLDESFTLKTGIVKGFILIRFTCAANWQGNNSGALPAPNGGTHRWSGAETDGPVITVEKPHDPLKAEWLFTKDAMTDPETGYAATFGGTTAVNDKNPGDGGLYVASNVTKGGKITYVQVDKTAIDTEGKAARLVGGTGHPYVNGAWPGDYWLFEASDGYTYKAGTKVHIKFQTRISATGHKYWKLEYWDGAAWQPVSELKEATVGEGDAAQTFQYNFEPVTASSNSQVDFTWTLAADCSKMQFRYTCMANWQYNGTGALPAPNGGTCRIAGAAGTSPIFEVVAE